MERLRPLVAAKLRDWNRERGDALASSLGTPAEALWPGCSQRARVRATRLAACGLRLFGAQAKSLRPRHSSTAYTLRAGLRLRPWECICP